MTRVLFERPATPADLPEVLALLQASGLPIAGVAEHIQGFVLALEDGELVGCAGLEVHGQAGLLRSVAVEESHRSQGLGARLTQGIIELARTKNLQSLSLLTTTAQTYFPRFGFEPIARGDLPAELAASEEFKGACPDTAIAMCLRL